MIDLNNTIILKYYNILEVYCNCCRLLLYNKGYFSFHRTQKRIKSDSKCFHLNNISSIIVYSSAQTCYYCVKESERYKGWKINCNRTYKRRYLKMRKSTLLDYGSWYKGNTHCHTTYSDGSESPKDTAEFYYNHGYSFLFITDHGIYKQHKECEYKEFLIFPSAERDVNVNAEVFKNFHIVGAYDLETNALPYNDGDIFRTDWENIKSVQNIIDDLTNHGNIAIIAHPVWSRIDMTELLSLKGFIGIEIYNNVCEIQWHNGQSLLYWDLLWKNGIKLWGFAVDDSHRPEIHALGGWIVVKSLNLTYESIMSALKSGSFYSSTGPQLLDFYVEDNVAYVDCSDVAAIHFITYDNLGLSYYASNECYLTHAQHTLTGQEKFVRVEITDNKSKSAWSNPIWLK